MIFKFRRLLLRFDRLSYVDYAFKTLAYTMINPAALLPRIAFTPMAVIDGAGHQAAARLFHSSENKISISITNHSFRKQPSSDFPATETPD
jgi:hypothetical protein